MSTTDEIIEAIIRTDEDVMIDISYHGELLTMGWPEGVPFGVSFGEFIEAEVTVGDNTFTTKDRSIVGAMREMSNRVGIKYSVFMVPRLQKVDGYEH